MDLLDVVILLILAVAVFSGFRRGLSWGAPSTIGLLAGLLIGAVAAPPLARALTHNREAQPLVALGAFLAITLVIEGVGAAIGFQARRRTLRTRYAPVDSLLGALLSFVTVLAGAWYVGLTFSQGPWPALASQIDGSRIVRTLDDIAPRPPAFLSAIQNILRGTNFPNPFSSIAPTTITPAQIPAPVDTAGVRAAAAATYKVIAAGCGGGAEAGSSWPIAPGYVVTNAHVVAGSGQVTVQSNDGAPHPATVVLYDPNVDVAILHVQGLASTPLATVPADPPHGTTGAVIGYPGGGGESVVPAAVSGTESAQGYNVYGDQLVTRDIEVLAAHVIPGNSGGPIVDDSGRVIGLVFAASTTDPSEGYALTVSQIAPDVQQGVGRTQAVSTQSCTS